MSDPTRNDQMAMTVIPCPDGTFAQQVLLKGGGTSTPNMMCLEDDNGLFYAIYYIEADGTISSISYVDVDGNAYTPVGGIKKPNHVGADVEQKLFCDDLGNKYYKHTVYDEAGAVLSIFDTDLSGAVYIPTAPETLCENEGYTADAELLCDIGNANKPYLVFYVRNLTTGVTTSETFELDGTTAYTPTTPGVHKPKDYELIKAWVVDTTGLTTGAIEKLWDISAVSTGTGGDNAPVSTSFPLLDSCGLPMHASPEDSINFLAVNGILSTDITGVNVPHQNQIDYFILVPEGGAYIQFNTTGDGDYSWYGVKCGGKLTEANKIVEINDISVDYEKYFSAGVYQFRTYINDPSQNGRVNLRWRFSPSDALVNLPLGNIFQEQPAVKCEMLRSCVEDGVVEKLDGTAIAASENVYYCNPCDESADDTYTPEEEVVLSTIVGTEALSVTDAAVSTLTIPVDADSARVQVFTDSCIFAYSDGRVPAVNSGFSLGNYAIIELGCLAGGALSELTDFQAISNVGETSTLQITYYKTK